MIDLRSALESRTAVGLLAASSGAVALAGGEAAGGALRALAVVALLALGGVALRQVRRPAAVREPPLLQLTHRLALGKESGVAIVTVDGRRLLLGYGASAVAVLAEVGPAARMVKP